MYITSSLFYNPLQPGTGLSNYRKSVAQQLPNYREWQQQIGNNSITEYHYRHLEMAHQELELMIAQGRDALEEAYTRVSKNSC